ncbi:hypothetical protein [Acetobacter syzygii]|uniref:hypothetical protein n=1 Tax=Acetobacter syzygii TaxID=146476 RepID=UPI0039EC5D94
MRQTVNDVLYEVDLCKISYKREEIKNPINYKIYFIKNVRSDNSKNSNLPKIDHDEKSQKISEWYRKIDHIDNIDAIGQYISQASDMLSRETKEKLINLFHDIGKEGADRYYNALIGFMRIIPFSENSGKFDFYTNDRIVAIGITIVNNGSLSIQFKDKNMAEFSYAKRGEFGGLIKISGVIKLTSAMKNSHEIYNILDFVGGK